MAGPAWDQTSSAVPLAASLRYKNSIPLPRDLDWVFFAIAAKIEGTPSAPKRDRKGAVSHDAVLTSGTLYRMIGFHIWCIPPPTPGDPQTSMLPPVNPLPVVSPNVT